MIHCDSAENETYPQELSWGNPFLEKNTAEKEYHHIARGLHNLYIGKLHARIGDNRQEHGQEHHSVAYDNIWI